MAKLLSFVTRNEDWLLILCLRLAVLFHRGRADLTLPHLRIRGRAQGWVVEIDADWNAANTLTQANLEAEQAAWESAPFSLRIKQLRVE